MEFERQILGKFVENPLNGLLDLVQKYIDECDAFDEIHCTGIRDNRRVPNNTSEAGIIQKHATELKQKLFIEVKERGFSEADFKKALIVRRFTCRYS